MQVDGDYVGDTPVMIEAVPRALRLMVPPTRAGHPVPGRSATAGEPKETAVEWMHRMARDVQNAIRAEH